MLHYILQTIAFQLFFLVIYDAFLKKETFFNWNRAYLLGTAIVSIVLPFIQIQSFKNVVPRDFVMAMPEVIIGNSSEMDASLAATIVTTEASKFQFSWELLFYIGAFFALVIFMVKLIKIVTLIYKNPKYWNQNLRIVTLLKSNTAFSFFYYVFLGEYIKEEDKPTILKHEAVHVNQKHTLDLLVFEVFRIVFWFNPLIYMYQSRMASLHEFIADAESIKSRNKNDYYQDLLSQIFETEKVSFINTFYKKSLIKKRIVMLSKAKSKQIQLIKYALLIPLVFGMLLYTSSYAQDKTKVETVKQSKATQKLTDKELQDKYYVEMLGLYSNKNIDGMLKNPEFIKEKYIKTREEYYRYQASQKVMLELSKEPFVGDKKVFNEMLNRSYAGYLELKKSDESKRAWDSQSKSGVLRLVVNDIANITKEEKELKDKKLKMIENDDYFKELLIVDLNGKSRAITPEVLNLKHSQKPKTTSKTIKQTQTQDSIEVPFAVIEEVPTLPGCENLSTNKERRNCVSEAISKHVQDNFNADLAGKLGLTGKQRISVIFKIDTNGNVVNVRSRAPHPDLEAEAIRVINTLPQFTPGKQKGKKVIVPYSLPIIFEVKDETGNKANSLTKANDNAVKVIEKQDISGLVEVPFAVIEQVPTYPGCETISDPNEQRKCMADSITRFVQKKFNTKIASDLGLKGRQRISTIFKIDTTGNVVEIRSRAPNKQLEDEAKRVIGMLPKMIPGQQKGKKVVVPYSLPIIFQVGTKTTSASDSNTSKEKQNIEEVMEVQDLSNNNGLPFAIVDKVPTLPQCESLSTNDAQKKCVSDEIIKFVQKKFNTDLAKDLGLKGRQQITSIFKIDTHGNVVDIRSRAANKLLEDEAKRVIGMLPKFIPGEDKGKKVNVSYSLPIVFKVNE